MCKQQNSNSQPLDCEAITVTIRPKELHYSFKKLNQVFSGYASETDTCQGTLEIIIKVPGVRVLYFIREYN